jgi:nicotinamide N-methyltransferase
MTVENIEDILSDSLEILGGKTVGDPGYVQYGDLKLTVAPKVNSFSFDHR